MESSTFWFGIVPVIAFVVLESFAGKRMAIVIALVLACAELVFSLVVYGAIDELTILAFVIVIIAGVISVKTGNDLYFKLQPALVSVATATAFFIYYYLLDRPLLTFMMHKYLPSMLAQLPADRQALFEGTMRVLSRDFIFWFLLHAVLTAYAAVRLSKWWWFAIRVPGLYLMLFLATFIAVRGVIPA